jgi:hypothetical protein
MLDRLRDERGISAVIVAVSLIALFGAAVLSIDAGSAWATRRKIVTGTDSAALGAARMFATGLADPCTAAGASAGEAEGTTILTANAADAEHNGTSTPNGYEVSVTGCGTPNGTVGHVRYDGRLGSTRGFAGIFGFAQVKPFSSSTAQFGYITAITEGLRPWTICDQRTPWDPNASPPTPLPPPVGAGPFAHFALWNWLQKGQITQAQYDAYFGTNGSEYPTFATNGVNSGAGKLYLSPALGGGVVHRINLKDNCGGGASWRGWMDYSGTDSNTNTIRDWIINGYNGRVGLPQDCGSASEPSGHCDYSTGNHNGLEGALDDITCPYNVQSKDCFTFPVVLNDGVYNNGGPGYVDHNAFVFVILRGYGANGQNNPCQSNSECFLDMEFVRIQADGEIGSNPSGGITTPKGVGLCGVDHDSVSNRCNV